MYLIDTNIWLERLLDKGQASAAHLGLLLDLASIRCLALALIQALGLERPLDMGDARR